MPRIEPMTIERKSGVIGGSYPAELLVPGQTEFDGKFEQSTLFECEESNGGAFLWESKAGQLQSGGYPHDEYCFVTKGDLEVVNEDGSRAAFGPGDHFVIPKGWVGVWNMRSDFAKVYVPIGPMPAEWTDAIF